MLTTPKNWTLTAYTDDAWTDVVDEPAVLAAVIIANTSPTDPIVVSLRLSGGAVLLPDVSIDPGPAQVLDLRSLVIQTGEQLQIKASAAGINVTSSGAV